MASSLPVTDIRQALSRRLFPTVTTWNRLEARPRMTNFDRALRAEVRDALWMLTKQWQMGEFRGSDAGSPVFAKLQMNTTRLTKYRPDAKAAQLLDASLPFETKVEQRPAPFAIAGQPVAFDLRLAMGRQWLALIKGIADYRQAFINAYPIAAPDPTKKEDAYICAHSEVWQTLAAVAARAMDGALLYLHLKGAAANKAYDGVAGVASGDYAALDDCAARFVAWFERQLTQPGTDDAWIAPRLEYQFAASAPLPDGTEKVYLADEYSQGELDWYSLDVDGATAALDPVASSGATGLPPDAPRTVIPIPVSFAGMPNTRWWAFEDRKTNFGDISASTTDLAKLLFMEFALVYANDWFVIPYTLPANCVASIQTFVVTNVFGERFAIDPAGSSPDSSWQRWSMFTTDVRGKPGVATDPNLVLLPTSAGILESPPTEDVMLIRDEVANMVWGIERMIPAATGEAKRGIEAARQLRAFLQAQLDAVLNEPPPAPPPFHAPIPGKAPIRYEVMNTVPENWIPFIPVHVPDDNREIQLQRAALPRIFDGDPNPPLKIQPRSVLLREGLDRTPAQTYFLFEEEVPRAGTRLMQAFERTRWSDGQVYTWLRVRRQTGRGEGASGLGFDKLITPPQ